MQQQQQQQSTTHNDIGKGAVQQLPNSRMMTPSVGPASYDDLPLLDPDDLGYVVGPMPAFVESFEAACQIGQLSTVQSIVSSQTRTPIFLHNGFILALSSGRIKVARYLPSAGAPIARRPQIVSFLDLLTNKFRFLSFLLILAGAQILLVITVSSCFPELLTTCNFSDGVLTTVLILTLDNSTIVETVMASQIPIRVPPSSRPHATVTWKLCVCSWTPAQKYRTVYLYTVPQEYVRLA